MFNIGFNARHVIIYCDNWSVICLAKNPTFHARTKHINVQFNFVRDMMEDGKVKLENVGTLVNVLDALKNPMSTEKFKWCVGSMGLGT